MPEPQFVTCCALVISSNNLRPQRPPPPINPLTKSEFNPNRSPVAADALRKVFAENLNIAWLISRLASNHRVVWGAGQVVSDCHVCICEPRLMVVEMELQLPPQEGQKLTLFALWPPSHVPLLKLFILRPCCCVRLLLIFLLLRNSRLGPFSPNCVSVSDSQSASVSVPVFVFRGLDAFH